SVAAAAVTSVAAAGVTSVAAMAPAAVASVATMAAVATRPARAVAAVRPLRLRGLLLDRDLLRGLLRLRCGGRRGRRRRLLIGRGARALVGRRRARARAGHHTRSNNAGDRRVDVK